MILSDIQLYEPHFGSVAMILRPEATKIKISGRPPTIRKRYPNDTQTGPGGCSEDQMGTGESKRYPPGATP